MKCYEKDKLIYLYQEQNSGKPIIYIFVGRLEPYQLAYIKEIDNKTPFSIPSGELKTISSYLPTKEVEKIANLAKNHKIIFVNDFLLPDTTITELKRKIFIHCSIPSKGIYYTENNIELWVDDDGKVNNLGIFYERFRGKLAMTSFNDVCKTKGFDVVYSDVINDNGLIIETATKGNYNIHFYTVNQLIEKYKNKFNFEKPDIVDCLKLFFPKVKIEKNIQKIKDEYTILDELFARDSYLINMIKLNQNNNEYFEPYNITQAILFINRYGDEEENFINLSRIFQKYQLSSDVPLKRFKELEQPEPQYLIYLPDIENKVIPQTLLKRWLHTISKSSYDIRYPMKGISFKKYLYTTPDNERIYATIDLYANGKLKVLMSFREAVEMKMGSMAKILNQINSFIDDLNTIDYQIGRKKKFIEKLDFDYDEKEDYLETKGKTEISYLNTNAKSKIPFSINYLELNNLAKAFTPYVVPTIDPKYKITDALMVRYKRINNYEKMEETFQFIADLKAKSDDTDDSIISLIRIKFDKNQEEAVQMLQEYKRRYSYGMRGSIRQNGIEIILTEESLILNSVKDLNQMCECYEFIQSLIKIYEKMASLEKDKEFQKFAIENIDNILKKIDNLDKKGNKEDNGLYQNIENNNSNVLSLGSDLGNIEDYLLEDDEEGNPNENLFATENKEKENTNDDSFKFMTPEELEKYKAKEKDIDKNIRLKCEISQTIEDKGVCEDICENNTYVLHRLQTYDNLLFKPRGKSADSYARKCGSSDDRQPIVLPYNPKLNPKIDPESYTYALGPFGTEGRNNYYICPRAWCPFCELPIKMSAITKIYRKYFHKMRKECITGLCPFCNKQVFIMSDKYFSREVHPRGAYPGFLKERHPEGYCLPCCFIKPQNLPSKEKGGSTRYKDYMRCLGKDVEDDTEKTGSIEYIYSRERSVIPAFRFGLLPEPVESFFNSKADSGLFKEGSKAYLRGGVNQEFENQSFLCAIADLFLPQEIKQKRLQIFKEKVLIPRITEEIFLSSKMGELKKFFTLENSKKTAFENFKDYLLSNEKINEEFLWDILQKPNILEKFGVNIFIFTSRSLLCPMGEDLNSFYSPRRKSVFLIKDRNELFYETIQYVENNKGQMLAQQIFGFDDPIFNEMGLDPVLKGITTIQENCGDILQINWNLIRKKNLKEHFYPIEKEFYLHNTLIELEKLNDEYKPIGQLIDNYNKTIGIILKNKVYVPVRPSARSMRIPVLEDVPLTTVEREIFGLNEISSKTDLNLRPIQVIMSEDNDKVVALLTETERFVPVIEEKSNKSKLPIAKINFFGDIDDRIENQEHEFDNRVLKVQKYEFEQETYLRVLFEISKFIRKNDEYYKKLIEIMDKKGENRKERMEEWVNSVWGLLITDEEPENFDIRVYHRLKERKACFSYKDDKCKNDMHCSLTKDGKCKLYVPRVNLVEGYNNEYLYKDKLVNELLYNTLIQHQVIEDTISETISFEREFNKNEILISGSDVNEKVKILYHEKKELMYRENPVFSTVKPDLTKGINVPQFIHIERNSIEDQLKGQMSGHWQKLFGDKFKIICDIKKNDTFFISIVRTIHEMYKDKMEKDEKLEKILKGIDVSEIKHQLVEFIQKIKNDDLVLIADTLGIVLSKDFYEKTPINNLIDLYYETTNIKTFNNFTSSSDIFNFIYSNDYIPNIIDILILSMIYKINILVLEKRLNKRNPKQFYCFNYILSNQCGFSIYYMIKDKNNFIFHTVAKDQQTIFTLNQIPSYFRKEIETNCITCKLGPKGESILGTGFKNYDEKADVITLNKPVDKKMVTMKIKKVNSKKENKPVEKKMITMKIKKDEKDEKKDDVKKMLKRVKLVRKV